MRFLKIWFWVWRKSLKNIFKRKPSTPVVPLIYLSMLVVVLVPQILRPLMHCPPPVVSLCSRSGYLEEENTIFWVSHLVHSQQWETHQWHLQKVPLVRRRNHNLLFPHFICCWLIQSFQDRKNYEFFYFT